MQEILQKLSAVLHGAWKFRWMALVVAWVVAIIGVVVVWKIPDRYEASARIYVDTDSILKPLMAGMTVAPNVEQQISILSRTLISRPNIEKLIRMADLDLKSQGKAEQELLIETLMKTIEIKAAAGTNLYTMNYRDKEPERAKRVVQSMVSIFVESGLGSSRKDNDSAKTFLSEQIKAYEKRLEESETRLKEFKLRNLDLQGPDGKDAASRLAEISQQLEAAKLQLKEAENARDAAKSQLSADRNKLIAAAAASGGTTDLPVATPELDTRIEALKRTLDGLLQRYTEQHPDVVTARRMVRELEDQRKREVAELRKAALAAAANQSPVNAGPNTSLAAQELGRSLAASEVQVAALKARVAEFSARMSNARQSLKVAPQIEAEAAQLNRDYAITKKNYDDLVARRQSAVLSGDLDVASGVADFRLIDPPRVSPQPVWPNRILLNALVLVVALGLGFASAFAASQLRPVFSDPDELRQKTGLPLLGVVTMLVAEDDRQAQRSSLYRYLAASGGLVGLFIIGIAAMALANR